MLEFDDYTMAGVMADFDPDGTGGIDFNEFCTLVMGQDRSGKYGSGATASIPEPSALAGGEGGDIVARVAGTLGGTNSQRLGKTLKMLDKERSGVVGPAALRRSLARTGVPLSDDEFSSLASVVSSKGGGVDYKLFMRAIKDGSSSVYLRSTGGGKVAAASPAESGRISTPGGTGGGEREALWAAAQMDAAKERRRSRSSRGSERPATSSAAAAADMEAIAALPVLPSPTVRNLFPIASRSRLLILCGCGTQRRPGSHAGTSRSNTASGSRSGSCVAPLQTNPWQVAHA